MFRAIKRRAFVYVLIAPRGKQRAQFKSMCVCVCRFRVWLIIFNDVSLRVGILKLDDASVICMNTQLRFIHKLSWLVCFKSISLCERRALLYDDG